MLYDAEERLHKVTKKNKEAKPSEDFLKTMSDLTDKCKMYESENSALKLCVKNLED